MHSPQNAGCRIEGRDPKSKKEMKQRIEAEPHTVTLYSTSVFGQHFNSSLPHLDDGWYVVTGPNPYDNRKWYANVKIHDGIAKVS